MVGSSASVETETNPNVATRPCYLPCARDSCTSPSCCAQGTLSLSLPYIFQLYLTYKLIRTDKELRRVIFWSEFNVVSNVVNDFTG
jgi:hypothetical protein